MAASCLMLWHTGARIISAYAQTVDVRHLAHPDLGWTLYRFDTGAVGILEDVWFLPDKTGFQSDERMEIIRTEGSIHIHETHPNLSVCDKDGWHWALPPHTNASQARAFHACLPPVKRPP
jgi:predicted dehydrogenase